MEANVSVRHYHFNWRNWSLSEIVTFDVAAVVIRPLQLIPTNTMMLAGRRLICILNGGKNFICVLRTEKVDLVILPADLLQPLTDKCFRYDEYCSWVVFVQIV